MSQPTAGEGTGEQAPAGLPERFSVAGSGAIACGLAAAAAARASGGDRVLLWARSTPSAERARKTLDKLCSKLGGDEVAGRIEIVQELDALSDATLCVESVVEDVGAKAALFAGLDARLAPEGILASSTSSLNIERLAVASGRPQRFCGLHPFNPVTRMDLVELCYPTVALADTRERARAFCDAIGKTAVEVPDQPGFVVNKLLFPYLFDAVRLMERTGMPAEDIDNCMTLGAGLPMGPLALIDFVGLDVTVAIGDTLFADSGEERDKPPARLSEMVVEGKLGRKSGAGFYDYTKK